MSSTALIAHLILGGFGVVVSGALLTFLFYRPRVGWRNGLLLILLALVATLMGAYHLVLAAGFNVAQNVVATLVVIFGPFGIAASILLGREALKSRLISELQRRVEAHRRTLLRLRGSRRELEKKVEERSREVHEQERRLRIALRDSNITVSMQDPDLRYAWIRNAPDGFDATELIGKCDEDVLPPVAARKSMLAKRKAIESGEEVETEIVIAPARSSGKARYFNLTVEPYYDADGVLVGVLSVGVEVTEQRQREEQLKTALLEVSHRTKNQLAVLTSIARRLALTKPTVPLFVDAFEARLRALSICQDVLVEKDWSPPSLERLVRAQFEPYLAHAQVSRDRLSLSGPLVRFKPNAVQNVGLVLHELILNACTKGALHGPTGTVEVSWDWDEPDEQESERHLNIEWQEAGVGGAEHKIHSRFGLETAHRISRSALKGGLEISSHEDGLHARLTVGGDCIVE